MVDRPRRSTLRFATAFPPRAAALVTAALLLGACESHAPEGTIIIATASDVSALLPVVESSPEDVGIDNLLYLSLNSARWRDGATCVLFTAINITMYVNSLKFKSIAIKCILITT